MRGAESFAGLGVEVFVEEQLVAPGGILLEERGRPPDGPAAAAVGEEEAEEAEPRDVHQHHEVGAFPDLLDDAVSGGLLAPAVRDEPLHPRAEFRQPRPEGMWNR